MAAPISEDNVVEEYKIGNATIKICDTAYINRTLEEINETLLRLTAIGWEIVEAARAAGKDI